MSLHLEIAKQITSLNLRRGNSPSGRWQKCLDSESKCEGAKVGLGATTPSINTRVEAHANSDTMVVIIPVNIAIVFRSRTEGANLKESPSSNMEYIMQEFNWWLFGFIFMCTIAGLTTFFGWWWLLGVPVLLAYDLSKWNK